MNAWEMRPKLVERKQREACARGRAVSEVWPPQLVIADRSSQEEALHGEGVSCRRREGDEGGRDGREDGYSCRALGIHCMAPQG
jgi:hypothetical protein